MTAQRYERIPAWTRGDRLRKARLLTGLTARDFAAKIGVSHGTVSNAESDKHEVRRIVLNAWSMATGVPVEWLESGDEPTSTPPPGQDGPEGALAELTRRKQGRVTATTNHGRNTRGYLAAA